MGKNQKLNRSSLAANREFRVLRITLALGSLYDAVFGIWILTSPSSLAALLGLNLPVEEIYLRLVGLFLLILQLVYLTAVFQPARYLANVGIAIGGRTLGAVFFLAYVIGFGGDPIFALLGGMDLLFAILHSMALGRGGWSGMAGCLRPEVISLP